MRTLTLNELNAVAGGSYAEDIVAVAGTLYVAGTISSVTTAAAYAAGQSLIRLAGGTNAFQPFVFSLQATTAIAAPLLGLAAPFYIGSLILEANPGLQDTLVDKFHSYFG